MLSSIAEKIYWLSRYIERIENTSRLINVNSDLLLDIPHDESNDLKHFNLLPMCLYFHRLETNLQ
jgi:uncharacterized alpha-E superfamily protein